MGSIPNTPTPMPSHVFYDDETAKERCEKFLERHFDAHQPVQVHPYPDQVAAYHQRTADLAVLC